MTGAEPGPGPAPSPARPTVAGRARRSKPPRRRSTAAARFAPFGLSRTLPILRLTERATLVGRSHEDHRGERVQDGGAALAVLGIVAVGILTAVSLRGLGLALILLLFLAIAAFGVFAIVSAKRVTIVADKPSGTFTISWRSMLGAGERSVAIADIDAITYRETVTTERTNKGFRKVRKDDSTLYLKDGSSLLLDKEQTSSSASPFSFWTPSLGRSSDEVADRALAGFIGVTFYDGGVAVPPAATGLFGQPALAEPQTPEPTGVQAAAPAVAAVDSGGGGSGGGRLRRLRQCRLRKRPFQRGRLRQRQHQRRRLRRRRVRLRRLTLPPPSRTGNRRRRPGPGSPRPLLRPRTLRDARYPAVSRSASSAGAFRDYRRETRRHATSRASREHRTALARGPWSPLAGRPCVPPSPWEAMILRPQRRARRSQAH